jgi:hypothetical protein
LLSPRTRYSLIHTAHTLSKHTITTQNTRELNKNKVFLGFSHLQTHIPKKRAETVGNASFPSSASATTSTTSSNCLQCKLFKTNETTDCDAAPTSAHAPQHIHTPHTCLPHSSNTPFAPTCNSSCVFTHSQLQKRTRLFLWLHTHTYSSLHTKHHFPRFFTRNNQLQAFLLLFFYKHTQSASAVCSHTLCQYTPVQAYLLLIKNVSTCFILSLHPTHTTSLQSPPFIFRHHNIHVCYCYSTLTPHKTNAAVLVAPHAHIPVSTSQASFSSFFYEK